METKYKIFRHTDGVHWISLEPLIDDMRQLFDSLQEGSIHQQQTSAVLIFLQSLHQEALMQDYRNEANKLQ
jgi:hypothetical protein